MYLVGRRIISILLKEVLIGALLNHLEPCIHTVDLDVFKLWAMKNNSHLILPFNHFILLDNKNKTLDDILDCRIGEVLIGQLIRVHIIQQRPVNGASSDT